MFRAVRALEATSSIPRRMKSRENRAGIHPSSSATMAGTPLNVGEPVSRPTPLMSMLTAMPAPMTISRVSAASTIESTCRTGGNRSAM